MTEVEQDRLADESYDAFEVHASSCAGCTSPYRLNRRRLCPVALELLDKALAAGCAIAGCCGVLMGSSRCCACDGADD